MKLFHLWRESSKVDWDEHFGFVVAAEDEDRARAEVVRYAREDGDFVPACSYDLNVWIDPAESTCQYIGEYNQDVSRVIIESFNAS